MEYVHKNWTNADILGLSLVPRMKATTLQRMVETYTGLAEALERPAQELSALGLGGANLFGGNSLARIRDDAARQLELCAQASVYIVSRWSDEYPALLREIYYAPTLLYLRGVLQPSDALCISIVGTRKCSQYGRLSAERFSEYFVRNNIIVVSGLANGIDTISHKAALKAGGRTYAVIASGIDKLSPALAARLAEEIVEQGGALISEHPCGTRAIPAFFPQRNRIISGISRATLVVESAEKGGALITAKFALDQNRELFAIPGNISSAKSAGTNMLIKRSQAALALSPEDMLASLGIAANRSNPAEFETAGALSVAEKRVYQELNFEPVHIDALAERSGIPVHELLVLTLQLEFKGLIRQLAGRQFIKAS